MHFKLTDPVMGLPPEDFVEQPTTDARHAAANATRAADRIVSRCTRGLVLPSASIIANCKTAPALMLVLAMLKV